jgi:hypothetical protein
VEEKEKLSGTKRMDWMVGRGVEAKAWLPRLLFTQRLSSISSACASLRNRVSKHDVKYELSVFLKVMANGHRWKQQAQKSQMILSHLSDWTDSGKEIKHCGNTMDGLWECEKSDLSAIWDSWTMWQTIASDKKCANCDLKQNEQRTAYMTIKS